MTKNVSAADNAGKFKDIIMRRLRRGEGYHMPYFGCREFTADFELFPESDSEYNPYVLSHGSQKWCIGRKGLQGGPMILRSLVKYYGASEKRGEITGPGRSREGKTPC